VLEKGSLKEGLEIVIMSRNRPQETLRAIAAIEKLSFDCAVTVIVSDNSSSPDLICRNLTNGVILRRREPSLDWFDHFNTIVNEAQHQWTLITHDDDELLPPIAQLFNDFCLHDEVKVITGLLCIYKHGEEIQLQDYIMRIKASGLHDFRGIILENIRRHLFQNGTLFPASATIIRSNLLKTVTPLQRYYGHTADYALSILIANPESVAFEGTQAVMNYHLHDKNSVSNADTVLNIPIDFAITRLQTAYNLSLSLETGAKLLLIKNLVVGRAISRYCLDGRRDADLLAAIHKQSGPVLYLLLRLAYISPSLLTLFRKEIKNFFYSRLGLSSSP
jgi:hypothetical protein